MQHIFQPMEFATWFDRYDERHTVTVLEVDNDEAHQGPFANIHYYTHRIGGGVTKWVPVSQLIPILEP